MNYAEYAPLARRTLKELPFKEHLEHMALGFCGEMGELLDATKKNIIYNKPLDLVNVMEEIGDVCWYVVNLCKELRLDPAQLDVLHQQNVNRFADYKLRPSSGLAQKMVWINHHFATVGLQLTHQHEELEKNDEEADVVMAKLGSFVSVLGAIYSIDIYQCLDANIKKLAARYGDKYSDFAALNRDTEAERVVLETAAISNSSTEAA